MKASGDLKKGNCLEWSCISGTYLAVDLMKKELGSQDKQERSPWSRIHERTILLRFLGIILRVLIFEVSVGISETTG